MLSARLCLMRVCSERVRNARTDQEQEEYIIHKIIYMYPYGRAPSFGASRVNLMMMDR